MEHDSIDLAVQQGAVAVVAERYLPSSVPQVIVDDSREAFATICHALSGSPARAMDLIGITGSYGKNDHSVSSGCDTRRGWDSDWNIGQHRTKRWMRRGTMWQRLHATGDSSQMAGRNEGQQMPVLDNEC